MLRTSSLLRLPHLSLGLALFAGLAQGQSVVLEPAKDNTIYESTGPATSNGAGLSLRVGRTGTTGGNALRRSLMAFDLSTIPAGATITSVSLQIEVDAVGNPAALDYTLHRVTQDWGEGTSIGRGVAGGAATTDDATWQHAFFPATFWSSVGGDFVPAAVATTSVADVGTYTFSSATMVSQVQTWLTMPANNFGWILRGPEGTNQSAIRLFSREAPDPANRPQLTVTYSVPCASAGVASRNAGSNPLSFSASPLVLGGTWTATVDNNVAGELASLLFAFDSQITLPLASGQTLLAIDGGNGELFSGAGLPPLTSAGGIDSFSLSVPNDPIYCGFQLTAQAIQFGTPPFTLSNAQDFTVGN